MARKFSTEFTENHLTRLIDAVSQLDNSRVLLTGGTGFVGKWLIKAAKIARQYSDFQIEIVVPTRDLSSAHALSTRAIGFDGLSFIEGDLLTETLDIGTVDAIIHAATPASAALNESNPTEMTRINAQSMQSALRYASNKIPFLFTSSGAVYGNQPQSMTHIPETLTEQFSSSSELTAYGAGKQLAERLCREAGAEGICKPIIARLFAFSGEYLPRDTHFAIGNFVQNVLDRKPIFINSDGLSRRSYLYGADMATWLWSSMGLTDIPEHLHIGSEQSISILELAQTVAEVSEKILMHSPQISIEKQITETNHFHQYVPETTQTRTLLRTEEWTSLEKSIELMISAALS